MGCEAVGVDGAGVPGADELSDALRLFLPTSSDSGSAKNKGNFPSKITFNLAYLPWLTSAISDSYLLFLPASYENNIALAKPEGKVR